MCHSLPVTRHGLLLASDSFCFDDGPPGVAGGGQRVKFHSLGVAAQAPGVARRGCNLNNCCGLAAETAHKYLALHPPRLRHVKMTRQTPQALTNSTLR